MPPPLGPSAEELATTPPPLPGQSGPSAQTIGDDNDLGLSEEELKDLEAFADLDNLDGPSTNDDLPAVSESDLDQIEIEEDVEIAEEVEIEEEVEIAQEVEIEEEIEIKEEEPAKPPRAETPPPPPAAEEKQEGPKKPSPSRMPPLMSSPPIGPPKPLPKVESEDVIKAPAPSIPMPPPAAKEEPEEKATPVPPASPAPVVEEEEVEIEEEIIVEDEPPVAPSKPASIPTAAPTPAPVTPAPSIPMPSPAAPAPRLPVAAAALESGPVPTAQIAAGLSQEQQELAQAIIDVSQRLRSEQGQLVQLPIRPDHPNRKAIKEATKVLVRTMRKAKSIARVPVDQLTDQVVNEVVGWGPIEQLLEDEQVDAIYVNGPGAIFVEQGGALKPTEHFFSSEASLERILQRMLMPKGIRVDRSNGALEARLQDGTWLHAILPPVAQHVILTLQPPKQKSLALQDLQESGLLSDQMQQFLTSCLAYRRNILLAGDPGSGRTTLLGALASTLPENERIVSVERVRELQLTHPHWVALESRPPEPQGGGGVTISSLLEYAQRMRPQRIIIGDLEGKELTTLMPRMYLGLDGVMMTARATSPEQLLYRLETALLSSPEPSSRAALHQQIGAAFDVVIQLNQFACGTRKVTSICELTSNEEDGTLLLNELFQFQKEGNDEEGHVVGTFAPTGAQPQFYEDLARLGVELDLSVFQASEE